MTGKATLERIVGRLELKEESEVLDCGCGVGGGTFFLAETYGAHVRGVELSNNAVSLALQRAAEHAKAAREGEFNPGRGRAVFECCDMTEREFGSAAFDAVLSRDVLLHVADKAQVLKRLHRALRPGGRLLVTDYCLGAAAAAAPSAEFADYIKQRGYHLLTIEAYAAALRDAGFDVVRHASPINTLRFENPHSTAPQQAPALSHPAADVWAVGCALPFCPQASAEDSTADFAANLKHEAEAMRANQAAFVEEFGKESFEATLACAQGALPRSRRRLPFAPLAWVLSARAGDGWR